MHTDSAARSGPGAEQLKEESALDSRGRDVATGAIRRIQQFERLAPGPGQDSEAVSASQRDRLRRALLRQVLKNGYGSITVRGLTRTARVSTADFYRHYRDKDDCLKDAYERQLGTVRCAVRETRDFACPQDAQLSRSLERLVSLLVADRSSAMQTLIAMPAATRSGLSTQQEIAEDLSACLSRRGASLASGAVSWIVAAVLDLATRLAIEERDSNPDEVARLLNWSRAYLTPDLPTGRSLDEKQCVGDARSDLPGGSADGPDPCTGEQRPERALIARAAIRLLRRTGYTNLTPAEVYRQAGVSRPAFRRLYPDLDHCLIDAIDPTAQSYIGLARESDSPDMSWTALYRWLTALREEVRENVTTAGIVFSDLRLAGHSVLVYRDRLIEQVAERLQSTVPTPEASLSSDLRFTAAAIWNALEEAVSARNLSGFDPLSLTLLALLPYSERRTMGEESPFQASFPRQQ